MARVTNAEAALRREQVAAWWAKGLTVAGIAARVGCDWETVKRDTRCLAARAQKELDVPRELHRLLLAAKSVEADCWERGRPLQALAAQRQQVSVLQTMTAIDLERRLASLEAQLAALAGGGTLPSTGAFQPLGLNGRPGPG